MHDPSIEKGKGRIRHADVTFDDSNKTERTESYPVSPYCDAYYVCSQLIDIAPNNRFLHTLDYLENRS